jgi:hypothetical protein
LNHTNPSGKDIYGEQTNFEIFSVTVTRVPNVSNSANSDLKFEISTNYNPNSGGALETHFGSLFLSKNLAFPIGPSGHHESDAVIPGAESRFTHVFDFDGTLANTAKNNVGFNINNTPGEATKGNGTATLFELDGDGLDVQASYYKEVGDTGPSFNFRQTQAVDFKGDLDQAQGLVGTWAFDASANLLTFLILNENDFFGSTFGLAWAMTCANDVVMGTVQVPERGSDTPIPGALPMFAAGLGLFGYLNHRRRKQAAKAAA